MEAFFPVIAFRGKNIYLYTIMSGDDDDDDNINTNKKKGHDLKNQRQKLALTRLELLYRGDFFIVSMFAV